MLTMKFMILFPEDELAVIAQLLANANNGAATVAERAEDSYKADLRNSRSKDDSAALHESQSAYEEFLNQVNQLGIQVVIIALQSLSERTLKRVLKYTFNIDLRKPRLPDLERALEQRGQRVTTLDSYDGFRRFWDLANAAKHCSDTPPPIDCCRLDCEFKSVKKFLRDVCVQ